MTILTTCKDNARTCLYYLIDACKTTQIPTVCMKEITDVDMIKEGLLIALEQAHIRDRA